jgi:hypothetical protein
MVAYVVGGILLLLALLGYFAWRERQQGIDEEKAREADRATAAKVAAYHATLVAADSAARVTARATAGHSTAIGFSNVAIRKSNAAVNDLQQQLDDARKAAADSNESLAHARAQRDSLATAALAALAAFQVERAAWVAERDSAARVIAAANAQRVTDSLALRAADVVIAGKDSVIAAKVKASTCRILLFPCPTRTTVAVVTVGIGELVRMAITKKP